jgi:hypothetical protein
MATNKGMVFGDGDSVGSGQRWRIGLAIGSKIERSRQGGFQQARVARSRAAAMFGELFIMNGDDGARIEP